MTQDFYTRLGIHAVGAMQTALTPADRKIQQQLEEFEARVRADVAPFGDMSPAGIAARWTETETTEAFGQIYAPHYCSAPSDAFHADVDALVDGYTPAHHPDGEAYVWPVHGPREHAKSIRSRVGLLKRVCRGTVHYPIIISEQLYVAQAHIDYLLVDLVANVRIAADYEVEVMLRDRSDGVLRLRVTPRATGVAHLVQLDACSYGRPVKGRVFMQWRPDFVLIDDFENTRSARNREISHLKAGWVLQEVYPAVVGNIVWFGNVGHDTSALFKAICDAEGSEAKGKALMRRGSRPGEIAVAAGILDASRMGLPSPPDKEAPQSAADARALPSDPEHGPGGEHVSRTLPDGLHDQDGDEDEGDLYADLSARPDDDPDDAVEAAITALVYRASRLVVTPEGKIETEYLWPSRYLPAWYTRKRKTMGPFRYEGEFNGFPSREGDVFKREWLEAALYDPDELAQAVAAPGWRMYSWMDPAFGKSGTSCDKAIVAAGSAGLEVFVVDTYLRNDEATVLALHAWATMFERHAKRGLLHGGYENDFGQDDRLAVDLDTFEQDHGRLNVSGDSNRRGAKDARIESMQPLASTFRLRFPREMGPDMERLFNQLLAYPSGNDDGPDALESAVARLRRGVAGTLEYESCGTRRYTRSGRRAGRRS